MSTGMYQMGNSLIHRLSALTKLICLFVLLAAAIFCDSLLGYALLLGFCLLCARLSTLGFGDFFAPVFRLRWFFIIIMLMNLCFYDPAEAWVKLWIFAPSKAGLMQGVNVVARVLFMLVMGSALTMTTPPTALTGGIERALYPLGFLRLPVGQIAMILSVAVQFIPALLQEADMIRKAQTARGAGFDSKRLRDKAGAVLPLVVPVFLSAFKRADELALAMEARGYRPDAPQRKKKYDPWSRADVSALIICAALCALEVVF